MKNKKKYTIMSILAVLILVGCFWFGGNEAKAKTYLAGGYCGLWNDKDVEWYLDDEGVLTFEGTGKGEMEGWDYGSRTPWYPYMDQVKKVVVEKGVKSIGSHAFNAQYPNLKKLTMADSVTIVGYGSFYGCKGLETVKFSKNTVSIKDFAFWKCENLKEITLPSSVKVLGTCAFGETGITSLVVPTTITSTNKPFQDCNKLVTVKYGVGSGNMAISNWEFMGCDNLETVIIGNAVTSIGHETFANCPKLKKVTIGEKVTSIAPLAFSKCTSLEEIVIPDSVSTIGNTYHSGGTFEGCTSLKKVTFGTGITYVGKNAFAKCGNIEEIYFCGDAPTFAGTETFQGSTATAYYPADNSSWRPTTMTNHGGKIDWVKWEVPVSHYRPTITSVTNKSNGILVKWSKVKYADGYYVYRKAGTATEWTKIATTTSRSYTDKKATYNGRKYQYKVVAFDEENVSKNSSSKTKYFVKGTTPSSLSNLSGKKMKVKWAKNSAASGYQIRYSKKSSFSSYSTKSVGKVTNTTISKLSKGSTYYVKMRAYKTVNGTKYYSDWSTVKKVKIKK